MNIILLDRDGSFLEYILMQRQDRIIVLVCEMHPKIIRLIETHKERILHIIDYNKLLNVQNVENIDYELIANMKHIQIDVETMLHRIMFNNPLAKDIYHQHLSFFSQIFQKYQIDLVLCAEAILASPNHLIPFGFAKAKKIPSYDIGGYFYNIFSLNNYNYNMPVKFIPHLKPKVEIEQILFYKKQNPTKKHFSLKKKFKNMLDKFGGEMLCEFFACLSRFNFQRDRLGISYNYFSKLNSFIKFKSYAHYYKKVCITPNLKEKYIYYSIHMEPEAAIIGRTLLESQLTIIKMLSKAIPHDWKLYVKEHPHQFMLNNETSSYFLNNIEYFKNISFLQEIKKLKNTEIVSLDITSKTLLENSQAVATMGGTITLESLASNKPAILFNANSSVYGILNNVLSVQSFQDLQKAITLLEKGFQTSIDAKKGFELLQGYLTDSRDPNFYHNLFSTIENHAKTIQPTGEKI